MASRFCSNSTKERWDKPALLDILIYHVIWMTCRTPVEVIVVVIRLPHLCAAADSAIKR